MKKIKGSRIDRVKIYGSMYGTKYLQVWLKGEDKEYRISIDDVENILKQYDYELDSADKDGRRFYDYIVNPKKRI